MSADRGFTLLEIVIAMGLLLLILASLGVVIPYSRAKLQNTSHQDLAASWAEDKADELQALPWGTLQSDYLNKDVYDSRASDFKAGVDGAGVVTAGSQDSIHHIVFNRCVRVETETDIYGAEIPDMMAVSVLIYWDEAMRSSADGAGVRKYREYRLGTKLYRW